VNFERAIRELLIAVIENNAIADRTVGANPKTVTANHR
jgi:hypothetical protein